MQLKEEINKLKGIIDKKDKEIDSFKKKIVNLETESLEQNSQKIDLLK